MDEPVTVKVAEPDGAERGSTVGGGTSLVAESVALKLPPPAGAGEAAGVDEDIDDEEVESGFEPDIAQAARASRRIANRFMVCLSFSETAG
jgi:hypothetical protein